MGVPGPTWVNWRFFSSLSMSLLAYGLFGGWMNRGGVSPGLSGERIGRALGQIEGVRVERHCHQRIIADQRRQFDYARHPVDRLDGAVRRVGDGVDALKLVVEFVDRLDGRIVDIRPIHPAERVRAPGGQDRRLTIMPSGRERCSEK